MSLRDASQHVPFSNGTEGHAWMAKWCEYCVHDHGAHDQSYDPGTCCDLIGNSMVQRPFQWPEAWLPEPDDGSFSMPSRLCCLAFKPCTNGGCTGDPGEEARAGRVLEVQRYWRENR